TATVTATRDATVLELDRSAYDRIAEQAPTIVRALLAAVSRRLGETSGRLPARRRRVMDRTIAIVHAGHEPIPPEFFERLAKALAGAGAHIIDRGVIEARFGSKPPSSGDIGEWLNALEWEGKPLVYLADAELTDWTRKCVRQADTVVM